MSQLLERDRVGTERLPRLFRNRTVDYTLITIGLLVAAFGAYTYFVPAGWILADLSEVWYLGSWIAGGVLLTAGFGMLGASVRDRSGHWTADAVVSFVLGLLSLAGAVTAAVVLAIVLLLRSQISRGVAIGAILASLFFPPWFFPGAGVVVLAIALCVTRQRTFSDQIAA